VTFAADRSTLQRVACHVLARARFAATGRFGLRATPGGFGTPAFGPDAEVVRVDGALLVREVAGDSKVTTAVPLAGSSLRELAAVAGVDLGADFSAGEDTPPVGDVDESLAVETSSVELLGEWYSLAWRALDVVVGALGASAAPSVIQLWPEHFDVAIDVAVAPGRRVNLGASPGDSYSDEPYVYVGPWDRDGLTGDYWNAPFGAALGQSDVDGVPAAVAFLLEGVERLS
jgi:hypothetical protein